MGEQYEEINPEELIEMSAAEIATYIGVPTAYPVDGPASPSEVEGFASLEDSEVVSLGATRSLVILGDDTSFVVDTAL